MRERQLQIEGDVKRCHVIHWQNTIAGCDQQLNSEKRPPDPFAKASIRKQRLDAVGKLANAESEERPLYASLESLAAELRELKNESSAIERSAQIP